MDWLQLATERQQELITELQQLIAIKSVLNEEEASTATPFGKGPFEAMQWLLTKGEEQGMTTKNIDNMAGHIEMGAGEDLLGILCHVDVVPAGNETNWQYPPFGGIIEGGKLFGRGAIDDKGPTMAAWLAMKLVKDAGVPLTKRVRMIIGTDEETGFRCVDRYFEKEEMPTMGFAPDADFPLINAEKGIADLLLRRDMTSGEQEQIVSFTAGHRLNMVPDLATAVLTQMPATTKAAYEAFLATHQFEGTATVEGNDLVLTMKGRSAHAMEPSKGQNAGVRLATFLADVVTTPASKAFATFVTTTFAKSCKGEAIALDFNDDMSGDTTLNPGIFSVSATAAEIKVSMRYSVTFPFEEKLTAAQQAVREDGFTLDVIDNSPPHHVSADNELVQALESVYRKYSGDYETPLLSTGGGTYARAMAEKGNAPCVAFGMLFPGEPDVAHRADEFVVVENLIKAAAIYAEAIVKLASTKEKDDVK
ncbi:Putative dipeptidase [Metalysinibacillus saudimassiliensis]|uniref:Putative dipeptidase n=1 Tax=Metalysinibacillus saudimassiliensis TaxID=1461583 RepID=A0A078MJH6_9BACL|nr:Putative dipeptidase [Metalysinibacillus saudimassiliensis]